MTSSGKKDYKEKHGMVICYVGYMWASDSIYFLVKSLKFRYSEKATKFDECLCGGYFQTGFCKAFENFLSPIPTSCHVTNPSQGLKI